VGSRESAAFLVLGSCARSTFIEIPPDITQIGWLEIDGGTIVAASRLHAAEDAEVWVADPDRDLVFIGYRDLDAGGAQIVAAPSCGPRLEAPAWVAPRRAVPPISLSGMEESCQPGRPATVCEPCASACPLSPSYAAIVVGRNLRGIVRVAADRLFVSGPPDRLVMVSIDPEGLEVGDPEMTLVPVTSSIGWSLVANEASVFVAAAGEVLVLDHDGRLERALSMPRGVVRLAAGPDRVLASVIGGPVFEIPDTGTIAIARTDLPFETYDVAMAPSGRTAVLTAEHIELDGAIVPLPRGFPSIRGREPNEGARIGIDGDDVLLAVEGADAHRYSGGQWSPMGWPIGSQPRALASLGRGVLIGGRSAATGGLIMMSAGSETCTLTVRSPVNGISARPVDAVAYAVTSGEDNGLLVEVRTP
jgi:hypothetical protein